MIFAIKFFFFFRANSSNLGQKPHICHFFLPFYREIIKVIYAILTIAIEDLEVQLSNLNLPIGKNEICFEPSAQKRETGKQMASTLCYKYKESAL